jgi:hypothetical protein
MLVMSNTRRRIGRNVRRLSAFPLAWVICFFATLAVTPVRADTSVRIESASLALDEGVYGLDADLAITLPDDARRAIESGLTLKLSYEVEIARVRRYLPDPGVATLVQSYELGYHALSQRWLLRSLNTGERHDFGGFDAAVERLSSVRGLPLIDSSLLETGTTYEVRVRAVLTLRSAPDTLSWLLFWTDDWSATSDWYAWTLRP